MASGRAWVPAEGRGGGAERPLPRAWVALERGADPVQRARELKSAHASFVASGDTAPPAGVRRVIVDSWRRSMGAGLPAGGNVPPRLHSDEDLRELRREHPLARVMPILRHLLLGVAEANRHLLVVCDAEGELLWIGGHARARVLAEDTMNFTEGTLWSEEGAGTNALGTALAVGHPIQVFAAEHYSPEVHPWTCSAAPIHDPETGAPLGTVDLTGPFRIADPHSLALVEAAARIAEATLRQDLWEHDERLRQRYLERALAVGRQPTAVVSRTGRVVMANPPGWIGDRLPVAEGVLQALVDGTAVAVDPLGAEGAYFVRAELGGRRARQRPALRLRLLGDEPAAALDGHEHRLSLRHAEVLALLAFQPEGLERDELGAGLYGTEPSAATVRGEVSRLRRILPGCLGTRPYRLLSTPDVDAVDLERSLAEGRLDVARRAPGPLLPRSRAPGVVAIRERIERLLHECLRGCDSVEELWDWCDGPWGQDDMAALRLLAERLPAGDARRHAVSARLALVEADRAARAAWTGENPPKG